jgi:hypothetical protein
MGFFKGWLAACGVLLSLSCIAQLTGHGGDSTGTVAALLAALCVCLAVGIPR